MSSIYGIINQISRPFLSAAVYGGLGYLAGHLVRPLHPFATLVCGATAGATVTLFFNPQSNLASKVVGLAILLLAPFKICEYLNLPITFKTACLITGLTAALALFVQALLNKRTERTLEEEVDETEREFDEKFKHMDESFKEGLNGIQEEFKAQAHKDVRTHYEQETTRLKAEMDARKSS